MGREMLERSWLTGPLAALCVFLSARWAQAQTVTGVTLSPLVEHSIARTRYRLGTQINYNDCRDDDVVSFAVALTNPGATTLEVWAGQGCDQIAVRTSREQTQ